MRLTTLPIRSFQEDKARGGLWLAVFQHHPSDFSLRSKEQDRRKNDGWEADGERIRIGKAVMAVNDPKLAFGGWGGDTPIYLPYFNTSPCDF